MKNSLKDYSKTVGSGGCGTCRVYYSTKFKRKVIEKKVGTNFIRAKGDKIPRLTTMIKDYANNELLLRKESIFMMLTQIAKLDCCVEILDFESNPFRIIMEYCEGGDLRKILNQYEIPIFDKIHMISQILLAIEKIHAAGFIHGDLKCANIFLVKKYIPGEYKNIRIKIGDFGLSELGGDLVHGGTPGFMAPEVPTIGGSFESDIYSIGKVMLEIMTQLPVSYIALIKIESLILLKTKLPKILNVSEFYNVVIPCLAPDPKKRPDARELFDHFHGLVAYWVKCEKMTGKVLLDYKIGNIFYVDCHEHPLVLSTDQMRQIPGTGLGWYCNLCNNKDNCFLGNVPAFHCKLCDFDLCSKCIELHKYQYVNDLILKSAKKEKKVYVSVHPHYLLISGENERDYGDDGIWTCDVCKVDASGKVYSFHCKICRYDVCLSCYKKFHELREKSCCCII